MVSSLNKIIQPTIIQKVELINYIIYRAYDFCYPTALKCRLSKGISVSNLLPYNNFITTMVKTIIID